MERGVQVLNGITLILQIYFETFVLWKCIKSCRLLDLNARVLMWLLVMVTCSVFWLLTKVISDHLLVYLMAASANLVDLRELTSSSSKEIGSPLVGGRGGNRKPQRNSEMRLQHKRLCGMYSCNVYLRNIMQNQSVALRSLYVLFWWGFSSFL